MQHEKVAYFCNTDIVMVVWAFEMFPGASAIIGIIAIPHPALLKIATLANQPRGATLLGKFIAQAWAAWTLPKTSSR
jgi:hypothetical protein